MNVVLKKKWGKPVTQVQRFVPQDFVAVCSYTLLGAGAATYGKVRIDWDNNHMWKKNEMQAFHSSSTTVQDKNLFEVVHNRMYEYLHSPYSKIENTNFDYWDDTLYSDYTATFYVLKNNPNQAYVGLQSNGKS